LEREKYRLVMRIKNLKIKNIGPFEDGFVEFIGENDSLEQPPITIITGENGTGKTIILDAIRALMFAQFDAVERNLVRNTNFSILAEFNIPIKEDDLISPENVFIFEANKKLAGNSYYAKHNHSFISKFFSSEFKRNNDENINWVANYWTSRLASDNFEIKSLVAPKPENYLKNALSGIQPNVEVTQLICFFDYLRSSNSPKEQELGEYLYQILKKIIKLSLNNGEFKYVERQTLTPIIFQSGAEISLDKLSSGNLYLIQRLVSLLGQMYSVHILNKSDINELCNVPGLLLIDEAENHLHPKWQKTFLNSILEIFPNLQIIVTTHSPFIVSSVKNARVYVCKSMNDYSVIENQTDVYSNMPIEEILLTPVFNTNSFNTELSDLIIARKKAVLANEKTKANEIEKKLLALNPEYFSYFEVEKLLSQISK